MGFRKSEGHSTDSCPFITPKKGAYQLVEFGKIRLCYANEYMLEQVQMYLLMKVEERTT